MKRCSCCKELKFETEFYKNKGKKDGLANDCKKCHKQYKQGTNIFRVWAQQTLNNHKRRGYIINVNINDIQLLAFNTKICKYCGIELNYNVGSKGKTQFNSPSLDRINNENELNKNNVQIICYNCNATKRSRTHNDFVKYCNMISDKF